MGDLSQAEWDDFLSRVDAMDFGDNGGSYSGGGNGFVAFGSQDEAFGAGVANMDATNGWGQNGWASSFDQALHNFNGALGITPGMIQGYYQQQWGNTGRTDISASYAKGVHEGQGFYVNWWQSASEEQGGIAGGNMFLSNEKAAALMSGQNEESAKDGMNGWETAGFITGSVGLSLDLTVHGVNGLANTFRGAAGVTNLGKIQLIKGISVEGAGKILGVVGLTITGVDMMQHGINWNNGTDAVMGAVGFIPVIGWAISGTYFISNAIISSTTGQSIGTHIGDYMATPEAGRLAENMEPFYLN